MRPSVLPAAVVLVWPSVACASFNGPIHFSFGVCVVIGLLAALPGAVVILLLEWKAATWTPPSWAGALAAVALVYCLLRLSGLVGPAGDRGLYALPAPPLIELVLVTFVPSPRVRHAAGWAAAVASTLLLGLALAYNGPARSARWSEGWGLICGGALATALLWQLGVRLGHRTLRGPAAKGRS